MSNEDLDYYERRAREERKAEKVARSPEAAAAHRLLATEYEAQARELRSGLQGAAQDRDDPVRAKPSPVSESAGRRPKLSIR